MLSVIIPTLNSERTLLRTLVALVPGAMDGLVRDVVVADGGSRDDTAAVADVAGCNFLTIEGPVAVRLKTAAGAARGQWLLFLQPGTVLDSPWTGEARRFIEHSAKQDRAAAFRRGAAGQSALRDALSLLGPALFVKPRPAQGLLISRQFYEALGGHVERAPDPERDLIRRIGRRRIATLAASAFAAPDA